MPLGISADGRYKGKFLEFTWDGVARDAVFRTFKESEKASEIDATAGHDDAKVMVLDAVDNTLNLTVVDRGPAHADFLDFPVGKEEEIVWYPFGNDTGNKKRTATGTVISRERTFQFDDITTFDVQLRLGAITEGVVA